ncbi:hypothetical protein VE23_15050 [Paenibacillus sp. D9]|uniref:GDP-mannose 4,6-dehydratase n=1 Tax=Paenibacillus sp. D9 TaxID=665792 RepID=UPI00061E7F3C|nr:GDP-mannose 4,6-dehydratase [Paenibacillus sp. D9]KKC48121.1 hypothetical protein VE23_15050 [Paenibacillus sp. D9]
MKKALVTGAGGFVGKYLVEILLERGFEVYGTTRNSDGEIDGYQTLAFKDESEVARLLDRIQPDYIYHLSGQSSVRDSWDNKAYTFESNVLNTIHLLEGVLKSSIKDKVKILSVGSSEEYGLVNNEEFPIIEETLLKPISPYGISKAAISMFAMHYYKTYGMKIIHVRPFNHIGPGQKMGFVASDFAKRITDIEQGLHEPVLTVGNITTQRDFLDVRDIVEAYLALMEKGRVGQVYNVCSGVPFSINDILQFYIRQSSIKIEVKPDAALMRPVDFPVYVGSNQKIMQDTGWEPQIQMSKTLMDILNYFRAINLKDKVSG